MNARSDSAGSAGSAGSAEPIAIIGMACLFPGAPDLGSFWRNILGGVDSISEPTAEWDAKRYLDSGRINTAAGGWLKDLFRFDPREFGIMPNSLDGGEPDQFLALRIARDALADAGYLDGADHRDTGIVLGHSTYLHRGQGAILQNTLVLDQTLDVLSAACPWLGAAELADVRALLKAKLPPSNADIAPGLVPNVMTGRIANRLNLKGPNYLLDAACSSSLLAVSAAMDELRSGRSRMMLAGGVNASLPAEVSVIFTQLGALSVRGKVRPFSTGSDGTLLGEGLGMVVLKRLDDALRDYDRVYAVVRGIGQASDGRGLGLLAPSVEGETLAIRRAYGSTGIDPSTIGLIEAHGTGIPLGDKTEIAALKSVFGPRRTQQGAIAVGSVKSMISHCIPAAGIAGLIKTALALQHRTLPPTLCDEVNPELGIADTSLYINTVAEPWMSALGKPRRAGIDSFGFGGINAHAIVEEAPMEAIRPPRHTPFPTELCVLAAENATALVAAAKATLAALAACVDVPLRSIASALAQADTSGPSRLAIVARDRESLAKSLSAAIERMTREPTGRWATRGGVFYASAPLDRKLAFIFPGEGSQYAGMLGDLACFDEVQEWFDFWHSLYAEPRGSNRTDFAFPHASELDDTRKRAFETRLHDMDVGSEAVFIAGQAMCALLRSFGIEPDVMLGHSSGESTALAASGAVPADTPLELSEFIRELNVVYEQVAVEGRIPTGALLAVGALPVADVRAKVDAAGSDVVVAMDNCANQLVLYGSREAIARIEQALVADGAICLPLPFDRGYHTADFSEVSAAFAAYYGRIKLRRPKVPLYSCASADRFPKAPAGVQKLAAMQWSQTVRFRETVQKMHADGVGVFVEVGPSGNLTAFVSDVLHEEEHLALASNLRRRNGIEQLMNMLAQLFTSGRNVRFNRLFEDRAIEPFDLARPTSGARVAAGVLLANTMPVLRFDAAERAALAAIVAPQPQADAAVSSQATLPIDAEPVRGASAPPSTSGEAAQKVATSANHDSAAPVVDGFPLLAAIELAADGRALRAVSRFDLDDPFIRSHVLSGLGSLDPELPGLACVPLMVSIEAMAEAACALAGRRDLGVIENVRAFDWVALDDGFVELALHAGYAEASAADALRIDVELQVRGTVVVAAAFGFAAPTSDTVVLPALETPTAYRWPASELYDTGMFHGPVFQSVAAIDAWSEGGVDARLADITVDRFVAGDVGDGWVTNPVLLDATGQLAAYWLAHKVGTDFNCFPSTIERIELVVPMPHDASGFTMRARQAPVDPGDDSAAAPRTWAFESRDASGAVTCRATGLVNVFFAVPHTFYEVRRDPLRGLLGQALALETAPGLMVWEVPFYEAAFCAQSNGIFLRILAHALLDAPERAAWAALDGSVRHRTQWLFGRAALKEAVRIAAFEASGELLYPSDVFVGHDAAGAPFVDGWWNGELMHAPAVSLSHSATSCVVAVGDANSPVGIDIEDLDRVRALDHLLGAFSAEERDAIGPEGPLHGERMLRTWCAKEAAAKLLGTGLQGEPQAFDVRFVDHRLDRAEVSFEASLIDVSINRLANSIVAVATGARAISEFG